MDANGWLIVSYVTSIFAVTAFAAYAVIYTTFFSTKKVDTTEEFITARRSQNKYRIGWSFFAGAVGAWVIVSPAQYASFAGVLGLVFYALASGIPLIVASLFGEKIQKAMPNCCSLSDFIGYRFGPTAKVFVVLICLFNMSIAMLAEYTTMGSLFKDFVGSVNFPIIIIVAILTITYTAYGGLAVSIMTDQIQGAFSVILVTMLTIYVAATFREPLPADFGEAKPYLGPNVSGYSAIFVMPCSLMAATVFSEAIWQRVWASEDQHALKFGAMVGASGVTVVVFLLGFAGVLGSWAGLITFETNPNLYLFTIFKAQSGSATVSSWIGLITLILAITMNESAVDSLQNGIAATLSAHWFKYSPVIYARVVVVVVNVILAVVATLNFNVLQLFLISNMLCSCWFIPVCLGLWDSQLGRRVVTETGVIFAGITAVLTTTAYGIGRNWNAAYYGNDLNPLVLNYPEPGSVRNSVQFGATFAWKDNMYSWEYFLVAVGSSVVGLALWSCCALLLERLGVRGPGISGVLRHVPGFGVVSNDKELAAARPAEVVDDITKV